MTKEQFLALPEKTLLVERLPHGLQYFSYKESNDSCTFKTDTLFIREDGSLANVSRISLPTDDEFNEFLEKLRARYECLKREALDIIEMTKKARNAQ